MNGLMLHCGAAIATLDEVRETATPDPTETHYPIPHAALIDSITGAIGHSGYTIVQQEFGLWKDGNRMFGVMGLENGSRSAESRLAVAFRNAHDKAYAAAFACGLSVFCCDNLSISGEVVIGRKHTRFIMRDLDRLVLEAVGKLGTMRDTQDRRFEAYRRTMLRDVDVHDILIRSVDAKIMSNAHIAKVLQEWRASEHEEFSGRNAWSLFNGYTEVFKDSNPLDLGARTTRLHGLLDLVATAEGNDPQQITLDVPKASTALVQTHDEVRETLAALPGIQQARRDAHLN